MADFFTADSHFGHANILKFEECRGVFESAAHMNEHLIAQWNRVVVCDDVVYHLGDFSFKREALRNVLPRLNGRKVLICGNHDPYFKRVFGDSPQGQALAREHAASDGFESVHRELLIDIAGIGEVKLCHFPYAPLNDNDELYTRYLNLRPAPGTEAVLIHGHVHSQWLAKRQPGRPLMINAGVDMWNLAPLSATDVRGIFENMDGAEH